MADENNNNIDPAAARAAKDAAERSDRIKRNTLERLEAEKQSLEIEREKYELAGEELEINEKSIKIVEHKIEALKGLAELDHQHIAQLERQVELLKEVIVLNKNSENIGKNIAESIFSVNNRLLAQAELYKETTGGQLGLGRAFKEISKGFLKNFDSLSKISFRGIDTMIEGTKEMVKELDDMSANFVQSTGASRDFAISAFQARGTMAQLGMSAGAAVDQAGKLYNTFREFSQLTPALREEFTVLAAGIEKLGGDAGAMADVFMFAGQMSISQTSDSIMQMAEIADAAGIPLTELSSDVASMGEYFVKMGEQAVDSFRNIAAVAKETGLSVRELYDTVSRYDSFEDASRAAGKLNQVLGGNLLTTYDLINASEEERIGLIRSAVQASGVLFDELDRYQQRELSDAIGEDIETTARLLGATSAAVDQSTARLMHASMSQQEYEQRVRDASTAMEKFSALMSNVAVIVGPIVTGVNFLVDGMLRLSSSIFGRGGGVAAAISLMVISLGSFYLAAKLAGAGFASALKTAAAAASTSGTAVTGSLSAMAGAAAGVAGSFIGIAAGVAIVTGSVAAVVFSIGYLVSKIKEVVELGPEAATSFGIIAGGIMKLSLAMGVAVLAAPGLFVIKSLLKSIRKQVNEMDTEKINSFASAMSSLSAIIGTSGLSSAADATTNYIEQVSRALAEANLEAEATANFRANVQALTELATVSKDVDDAKIQNLAALVQSMAASEVNPNIEQLSNAIRNLIQANQGEGREIVVNLDGNELGRWLDDRSSRRMRGRIAGGGSSIR